MESKALLDYSKLSDGTETVKPSSMSLSEYHFLLLIGNKVKVCFGHLGLMHPSLHVYSLIWLHVFYFISVLTFWFLHSLNMGVGCESDK